MTDARRRVRCCRRSVVVGVRPGRRRHALPRGHQLIAVLLFVPQLALRCLRALLDAAPERLARLLLLPLAHRGIDQLDRLDEDIAEAVGERDRMERAAEAAPVAAAALVVRVDGSFAVHAAQVLNRQAPRRDEEHVEQREHRRWHAEHDDVRKHHDGDPPEVVQRLHNRHVVVLAHAQRGVHDDGEREEERELQREQKPQEDVVVEGADARADPRAVVVVHVDASVALAAVEGARAAVAAARAAVLDHRLLAQAHIVVGHRLRVLRGRATGPAERTARLNDGPAADAAPLRAIVSAHRPNDLHAVHERGRVLGLIDALRHEARVLRRDAEEARDAEGEGNHPRHEQRRRRRREDEDRHERERDEQQGERDGQAPRLRPQHDEPAAQHRMPALVAVGQVLDGPPEVVVVGDRLRRLHVLLLVRFVRGTTGSHGHGEVVVDAVKTDMNVL
mmetsp:Transcript_32506/g.100583  ORF Transcript_32506/g.100583 Transcript_32506/m.100583 type:complete len:448 (-) Transcript_32506:55-1398(-)